MRSSAHTHGSAGDDILACWSVPVVYGATEQILDALSLLILQPVPFKHLGVSIVIYIHSGSLGTLQVFEQKSEFRFCFPKV